MSPDGITCKFSISSSVWHAAGHCTRALSLHLRGRFEQRVSPSALSFPLLSGGIPAHQNMMKLTKGLKPQMVKNPTLK